LIDPVIKEITVLATPDRAFQVFTAELASWWPLDSHSLSAMAGNRAKDVIMQPGVGGKIIEHMHDGSTVNWGVITDWDPGKKLGFTWHLRNPQSEQTHITVDFTEQGDHTSVRLTHQGWDGQGLQGGANRAQYQSGWDQVFVQCYAARFAT
jgi:hypothetical protein